MMESNWRKAKGGGFIGMFLISMAMIWPRSMRGGFFKYNIRENGLANKNY